MEPRNAKKIQTRTDAIVIDDKQTEEFDLSTRKLALVTGGGIRLGAAISRALAEAGYRVIVHANRHIDAADALATEIDGIAVQADLTNQAGIKRLFETVDQQEEPLSALVNNAAIFQPAKPESISIEQWDLHINLNLAAPFWCAQAAYSRFVDTGSAIVNLVDIAALQPEPDFVHYAATKAGLIAITKGLAQSWAPKIRVNGIAPGPVLMPEDYDESARNAWLDRLPMGDILGPDDIAKTALFLIDGPQGITGEIITVDGGWTTRV